MDASEHRLLDGLGHVAYASIVLGMILVAFKMREGWLFAIAGDVLWVYIGYRIKLWSVVLWQFAFIPTAALGWWNWA